MAAWVASRAPGCTELTVGRGPRVRIPLPPPASPLAWSYEPRERTGLRKRASPDSEAGAVASAAALQGVSAESPQSAEPPRKGTSKNSTRSKLAAREPAIVVAGSGQRPALVTLAADVGFAGFALRLESWTATRAGFICTASAAASVAGTHDLLSRHFRVIAFDTPGFDESPENTWSQICPSSRREGWPKHLPRSRRSRPSRGCLLPHRRFLW